MSHWTLSMVIPGHSPCYWGNDPGYPEELVRYDRFWTIVTVNSTKCWDMVRYMSIKQHGSATITTFCQWVKYILSMSHIFLLHVYWRTIYFVTRLLFQYRLLLFFVYCRVSDMPGMTQSLFLGIAGILGTKAIRSNWRHGFSSNHITIGNKHATSVNVI